MQLIIIGDLKGFFGLLMVNMQMLRAKLKVLDLSYGNGTANTALIYHHGKLLALSEADKPYVLKVLEDGDLQTLGLLDYDKRLTHSFTAHPKVDPFTGEMFTFGYAHTPPYITYRVISKDGFMHEPVPITVSDPIMMHDFAITENYAIFMDLPLIFKPKEMVKEKKLIFSFDATKKARFGVLPRYAKDELLIKWFELPNCFIFHNGAHSGLPTFYVSNAWEEEDEVVLITCRLENPDLDMVSGTVKEKLENFSNELYEMRFNMKTGLATQKQLSASAVDFPRVNESYTGRKSAVHVIDAKTMSSDPVAVVDLPHRVPYGFHAFFVTENNNQERQLSRTTARTGNTLKVQSFTKEEDAKLKKKKNNSCNNGGTVKGIVTVNPKPNKGLTSKLIDWFENVIVKLMYDSSQHQHYLSGNFTSVPETPPIKDLPVMGYLPECLNGEFVRVGSNSKFAPVAGYHWFDGDGMVHGVRIKDGKATYVSRYVKTSRLKQEEYFGGSKFLKVGDLKGLFGLFMFSIQTLRDKFKEADIYSDTFLPLVMEGLIVFYHSLPANTALVYHHGKLLVLHEADKPYVLKVLEDGDLQTLGMLDYDKRLAHTFTAHPKVDPFTGEMFTFGYSLSPPYVTYRVISKDGFMHDQEMVMENKLILSFDATKKARFGVLPRYAKDELLIKWFELPSCYIFHNANAWEEEDEVVLITCRLDNIDMNMISGEIKKKLNHFRTELYEKSEVHVIDAKTMSADPIAVIHLPCRVPYGFHAFFVTEVSNQYYPKCLFGTTTRTSRALNCEPNLMIHGLRIKNGKATYASRYVRTSRLKQEEYFGVPKFMKIGDMNGVFGLLVVIIQILRAILKVLDLSYGLGTGEMFTFGFSLITHPYITYRVISKDGFMHDPIPITIPNPIMMHDFAITQNYAIFMDLPLIFRPEEMMKGKNFIISFDTTKKARFGVLPRYAKDELLIK
ncbi:hypothetical protein F8388_016777 [Cannabis sativa]|uniref:carotenoid 9,10-dioxygenase n=1 Tax=Cannabis sativa TaxID=3483 RepID=A0A7J6ERF3_CANSA|nr:hypothetical protein F8388_016777 [Cannabis sativa]